MGAASRVGPEQRDGVKSALMLLHQGARDARELAAEIWDFAVEIDRLNACGATSNDLRWLIRNGLIAHRLETRSLRARKRRFRTIQNLCFTERSCFVLTARGLAQATALPHENQAAPSTTPVSKGSAETVAG